MLLPAQFVDLILQKLGDRAAGVAQTVDRGGRGRVVHGLCLGLDAQTLLREAPYVRVLAFDEMGRTVLRQAKKDARLTLVNAGRTPPDEVYYALERRCAALYGLFAMQPELFSEQVARIYQKPLGPA